MTRHDETLKRGPATLSYSRWERGDRPWVTLLNGFSRPARDFVAWMTHLDQRGFNALTIDNRGVGGSMLAPEFSLGDMADDVIALWDHVGVRRSIVLGVSMGGMIAQAIARRAADRLAGLVLVSTTNDHAHIRRVANPHTASEVTEATRRLSAYVAPAFAAMNPRMMESVARGMMAVAGNPTAMAGIGRQRAAVDGHAFDRSPLDCPALVIHGDLDDIIDPAAADSLGAMLPRATVEIIHGAGHMLMMESRERVLEITDEWLGALTRPRS